ncbi:unnamed protein product [Rotaria sordida]|uniref:Ubiquitin-conjugating enzyme E2 Z n=1 Tax=Rotaria sordida TaxID=392033 RepID=A0A819KP91_9BILA|nr:unnamed protein product [Rotaria sordida]
MSDNNNNNETQTSTQSSKNVNEDSNDDYSTMMRNPWDPLHSSDWDKQIPNATCLARIKRDITGVFKDPPPGVFIAPDPDNITKIHALVVGPFDTPYEGGFFYFIIRCPPDYPIRAPRCRLMTTGNNTVRFNPNLYRNGKVCLSILGTWSGPSWSPAQCLSSLIISIQSLMSENPYHNEPGYEQERTSGDSKDYNEVIKHETLRVAVCEILENQNSCPKQLREVIIKQFFEFFEYYVDTCKKNLDKDGQSMRDPFGEHRGAFEYSSILTRLNQLKSKLENQSSSNEQSKIDSHTQKLINSTSTIDPNSEMDLDDIFNNDDDNEEEEEEEEDTDHDQEAEDDDHVE